MTWLDKAHALLHPAYEASKNYGVPESWLVGLVFVECGRLDPKASRLEPAVFKAVMSVRNGGKTRNFPGFNTGKLGDYIRNPKTTIADLQTLATSYGLGQIMGYHYFNKWSVKPDKYTNLSVEESVQYTLKMMAEGKAWAQKHIEHGGGAWPKYYEYLLRWWNTGSVEGVTYHPDYVKRATDIRDLYQQQYG